MAADLVLSQKQLNSAGMDTLATKHFDTPILQNFKLFLLKFSSKNTREAYERAFMAFLRYWQSTEHPLLEVEQVQRSLLDIWNRVLEAQYPPSTVAAKLSAVLSFFQFCKQNGWIVSNLCA